MEHEGYDIGLPAAFRLVGLHVGLFGSVLIIPLQFISLIFCFQNILV